MERVILQFQCKDRRGIVARLSDFIFRMGGNIIEADQHSTDPEGGHFFIRIEFCFDDTVLSREKMESGFASAVKDLQAYWAWHYTSTCLRMGILVSRPDHCLVDLLYLWKAGELEVNIPCVVSSCAGHRSLVEQYGIDFHYLPAGGEDAARQKDILELVGETDFLALARYMRVLPKDFIEAYGRNIINIHHSFLPSFKGADPYRQAFERGVKVIGATAHFVSEHLDEGPIITQVVEPVSHKDDTEALIRRGKNLEKRALSQALQAYIDCRIFRHGNKTIVF